MIKLSVFLVAFLSSMTVFATPDQSMRMIHSHDYNISNSLGAVANNFNIKETFFVDSKSICRHLGIVKGSVDAVQITLKADSELKTMADSTALAAKLAQIDVLIAQTTSYCGRNYAAEGKFEPDLEGNHDFIKFQMAALNQAQTSYFEEIKKLDACVSQKACN